MIYCSNQKAEMAANIAPAHRKAADLYPVLADVIKAFDKKVYNIRFQKALREKTPDIFVINRFNNIEIYTRQYNRVYYLAFIEHDKLIDGKRIDANTFLESARKYRAEHLKIAADADQALNRINELTDQLNALRKSYDTISDTIPTEIRDIYNIHKLY